MTIITNSCGAVVRRSRNLRGLLEHGRRYQAQQVRLQDTDGMFLMTHVEGQQVRRYLVDVTYENGDAARTFFADWRVAADWFRSRRSWGTLHAEGMAAFVARYEGASAA